MSIWSDLLDWANAHSTGMFLFRGQGDRSPIVPKIARPEYNYHLARERELFDVFKMRARPFVLVSVLNDWEWLALAQHHGAPTRLTDWTTSPLVAAWFAVSSYPLDTDACVYALDIEGSGAPERIEPLSGSCTNGSTYNHPLSPTNGVYLVKTSPVSGRITTQRGLFLLHGNPKDALVIDPAQQFIIPRNDRIEVMASLSRFGIEASHIFPDLDGLCKSLDWSMRNGKPLGI